MVEHKILGPSLEDFEAWIKTWGGQDGLATAFKKKFGKGSQISQTAISNWVSRRRIPVEKRSALKEMGWPGPYEWPEEKSPANGTAGSMSSYGMGSSAGRSVLSDANVPYVTENAFAEEKGYWKGRFEALEKKVDDQKKVLEELLKGYQTHILKEPDKAHPERLPQ